MTVIEWRKYSVQEKIILAVKKTSITVLEQCWKLPSGFYLFLLFIFVSQRFCFPFLTSYFCLCFVDFPPPHSSCLYPRLLSCCTVHGSVFHGLQECRACYLVAFSGSFFFLIKYILRDFFFLNCCCGEALRVILWVAVIVRISLLDASFFPYFINSAQWTAQKSDDLYRRFAEAWCERWNIIVLSAAMSCLPMFCSLAHKQTEAVGKGNLSWRSTTIPPFHATHLAKVRVNICLLVVLSLCYVCALMLILKPTMGMKLGHWAMVSSRDVIIYAEIWTHIGIWVLTESMSMN